MTSAMDKEQLELDIQRVEREIARLRRYFSTAAETAASQPAPSQGEEDEEMTMEEAQLNVQAWAERRAFVDDSAVEMTRAQLREAEEINRELESLTSTLSRVVGERQGRGLAGTSEQVVRRIARWRHNRAKIRSRITRLLVRQLREIHEEPGYLTMQSLLNMLLSAVQSSPSDPYVRVTGEMFPPHLAMLERAGIVAFRGQGDEKYVRMLDLGPDPDYARLPVPPEPADTESPTTTNTSSQS